MKTQIVVVGGGAGGLELVSRLGASFDRKHFDIILVDLNQTHIWKPLLHEVAAGALDANLDEVGYRSHAFRWGYRYFDGKLEMIDRESKQIVIAPIADDNGVEIVARHRIRYDYLVLAVVGSVSNDFRTPGGEGALHLPGRPGPGGPVPATIAQPLSQSVADDERRPVGASLCQCVDRRWRRDRCRTGGGTL